MVQEADTEIQVKVRVYAGLRRFVPELPIGGSAVMRLPAGATIADLIDRLQMPHEEIKTRFVNGRQRETSYQLQDGDEVAFFPPIAGGR